jgi:branched-chain amino acid transport system ATP-binding protein
MSELELDVTGLTVSYGKVRALKGVAISVGAGEIVSLLGSNGAGKSTLLNAITAVVPKQEGAVRLRGEDVSRVTPWALSTRGLIQVPEGRQVFPNLTVAQHLGLAYRNANNGRSAFSIESIYDMFPRLKERQKIAAGNLSGGEQQMLVIGRALVTQPHLLLLDEPSLGLSPKLAQLVISSIASLREAGLSVLLVEQNAALALRVSDRVFVLANGEITAQGTAAEMSESDEVRRAYLG